MARRYASQRPENESLSWERDKEWQVCATQKSEKLSRDREHAAVFSVKSFFDHVIFIPPRPPNHSFNTTINTNFQAGMRCKSPVLNHLTWTSVVFIQSSPKQHLPWWKGHCEMKWKEYRYHLEFGSTYKLAKDWIYSGAGSTRTFTEKWEQVERQI